MVSYTYRGYITIGNLKILIKDKKNKYSHKIILKYKIKRRKI
jgi:hypothetical protein